jgi:hypothetical protein
MPIPTKSWLQPSISACSNIHVEGQSFYAKEIVLNEPYVLLCSDYSVDEDTILNSSEPELIPYECTRSSGVLSFWDDEGEDVYSFEDGQPV